MVFDPRALIPNGVDRQGLSPTALAYVGDAVYELYMRTYYLMPPKRSHLYHQAVVQQVRAEQQAQHLQTLIPHLNAQELEIVRRGRNSVHRSPRRLDPQTYQAATSLETLIGYLYLSDLSRLYELLETLNLND